MATYRPPDLPAIEALLRGARTIAIVGLSDNPGRASFGIARALQRHGYRIIPVTPRHAEVLGERAVPDLGSLGAVLQPGESVDLVNVFRRPEHVAAIVDDCIRLGLPALWLQDDVIDEAAAALAQAAGVFTVMDRCIGRDRAAMER